jgi:hypothetical protein
MRVLPQDADGALELHVDLVALGGLDAGGIAPFQQLADFVLAVQDGFAPYSRWDGRLITGTNSASLSSDRTRLVVRPECRFHPLRRAGAQRLGLAPRDMIVGDVGQAGKRSKRRGSAAAYSGWLRP